MPTRWISPGGHDIMKAKYECSKCGGPCDGSLGTDPICTKCARKHYPAFMERLDGMLSDMGGKRRGAGR